MILQSYRNEKNFDIKMRCFEITFSATLKFYPDSSNIQYHKVLCEWVCFQSDWRMQKYICRAAASLMQTKSHHSKNIGRLSSLEKDRVTQLEKSPLNRIRTLVTSLMILSQKLMKRTRMKGWTCMVAGWRFCVFAIPWKRTIAITECHEMTTHLYF